MDEADRENLLSPAGWLNDNVINAAQQLLSKQFPDLAGLQSTGLGLTMAFTVQDGEFLQILHSVNHWVTISTIGVQHPKINLYDSHYTGLPTILQAQISSLLCTESDTIEVDIKDVQTQVINLQISYYLLAAWTALAGG